MRTEFRGHYQPSDEEFAELWRDGIVVLDTNALLNLFRYSVGTRDELLNLLRKERVRIWMPHHVGWEFHRRRLTIPPEQEKAFQGVEKALSDARTSIETSINGLRRHPSQEAEELLELLDTHMRKLGKGTRRAIRKHRKAVIERDAHDRTFSEISDLYEGKVGRSYDADELSKLESEGKMRYEEEVPPGYKDATKTSNRYGDFLIWCQMLEKAREENRPMIFVTEDRKEDWWTIVSGKSFGARPELVEEYYVASEGKRIHFYTPQRFLEYAREHGAEISEGAVAEASKVSGDLGVSLSSRFRGAADAGTSEVMQAILRNYKSHYDVDTSIDFARLSAELLKQQNFGEGVYDRILKASQSRIVPRWTQPGQAGSEAFLLKAFEEVEASNRSKMIRTFLTAMERRQDDSGSDEEGQAED